MQSLPLWNLETPDTCCCCCRCCVTTRCGAGRGGVNAKVSWEWTSRVMWLHTPMASSVAIALPGSWRLWLCMTPIKIHETTGDMHVFILQVWRCQGLERKECKQTYPLRTFQHVTKNSHFFGVSYNGVWLTDYSEVIKGPLTVQYVMCSGVIKSLYHFNTEKHFFPLLLFVV